jgi:hypothetical protein
MDARLIEILLPAMAPCPNFEGCKGHVKCEPATGHIPRGFGGASINPADVRLILINAEPADPADSETYTGDGSSMLKQHETYVNSYMHGNIRRGSSTSPFHRNLRTILDLCWPGIDHNERWAKTWYTNTVLCSAPMSGGSVAHEVVDCCIKACLQPQLAVFPNAYRIRKYVAQRAGFINV